MNTAKLYKMAIWMFAWAGAAAALDTESIVSQNEGAVAVLTGERAGGQPVQGSACSVDRRGYLLSTAHQVEGVENLRATFKDGSEYAVEIVAVDRAADLALTKTAKPVGHAAVIGDVEDLRNGSDLVAISTPAGLTFTISRGIVSNLHRRRGQLPQIQTDLDLTGGASGGPVFDGNGRLVGVISAKLRDSDIATLMTPINVAFPLLEDAGVAVERSDISAGFATALTPDEGASDAERRAIEAYNRGVAAEDPKSKAEHYADAITEVRPFFEAWFNLAATHAAVGDAEGAVRAYTVALEIRPESVAALRNLGRAHLEEADLDAAAAAFHQATEIAPNDAGSHNDYGEVLRRQGKLPEAVAQFRKALDLRPDYAAAHYNLGLALAAQGNRREAREAFKAYLRNAPGAIDSEKVRKIIDELR